MSNLPQNPFAFRSDALQAQLKSTTTKTTYTITKQPGVGGLPGGGFTNTTLSSLTSFTPRGQDLRSLRDRDGDGDEDDLFGDDSHTHARSYKAPSSTREGGGKDGEPVDPIETLPVPPPAVDQSKVDDILSSSSATTAADSSSTASTASSSSSTTATTTTTTDALLWEKAFASINNEIASIDEQVKQQESKLLDDMVYQVSKAIEQGEMIPLPTQSDKSKEFTRAVLELYNKDKHKTGKVKTRKQRLKSEIAAKKAEDRFDKFDALTQNAGSYKKSLQHRRKNERRKMDW